ncbi:MaoC family dehydratase [Sphingomonas rosea]|uniref:MaoC family dehydratase n=1 Tax=Sphingomonas rosea TaxID=335605 RepID=A0ABP7THW8_9SPHN
MPGRFFEEWEVGQTVAHALRRTVTETDNLLISTLTHNPQPLHLDAEAAKDTEFGRILVNSCFTFSLLVGASVSDTTEGVLVANMGFDEVRLPSPVFIGDTLHFESECIGARESNSRPTAGLVTWAHRAINQHGATVCTMKRTALIHKRPAA